MSSTADRFTPVRPLGPYLLLVQDQDGTPLVLKRLADDRLGDPDARHEFRLEAWRVAQLRGPRVMRLYADATTLAERPFYTMGYAEGPPATLVQPGEAATTVRQLLEGLQTIHHRGWVHAALEPAHLRRTETGLVLVGYGNLTPMGQPARHPGVRGYRSPEQEAGMALDGRADLYGVGALIHYWLTGEGPGELDLLDLVADPLAALGRRLLSRDPADRPTGAAEALAELDGVRHPALRTDAEVAWLQPPMLRRGQALAPIEQLLDALGQGQGGARRLEAPAGWGKSVFLDRVAVVARAAGWPVVRLRGLGHAAWPLAPWREALGAFVAIAQERQPGLADRYRLRLGPLMAPPPAPGLDDDGRGAAGVEGPLGGELMRRRLGSALGELLAALAAPGLVVLADDWDEADEASRELLNALVARVANEPVLWLAAGQPGEAGDPSWPVVALPPFSADETLRLVQAMLPRPAQAAAVQTLAAAAAGQPWFVRTAVGLWRDAGELRCGATQCELPDPETWPDTVGALAWRRGSALDQAAWTVGGVAALVGPRVRPAALDALVPEGETLGAGLDALLRAGVLTRTPDGYAFSHPEFAALYAQALPPERQLALHHRFVEAALAGELAADPLEAALHAVRAEWPEAAAPLALAAARRVLALGGVETARLVLEEGLVMLDAEHVLRGAFLATLGEAHRQGGDPAQALVCLREARGRLPAGPERPAAALALARVLARLGLHEEAAGAWREAAGHAQILGEMDLLALALAGLTESQLALGQLEDAAASGEAAVGAAAEAAPLPRALALAAFGAVLALGVRERQSEGVALLQQASALFESEGDRPRLVQTLLALGDAELARGELLFARGTAERAIGLAEDLDDAQAAVQAGIQAAIVTLAMGDPVRAGDLAADARRRAEARHDAAGAAEAQAYEGLARTLAGEADAGIALGNEALRRLPALASSAATARVWLAHAEALLDRALYPEAANALHIAATSVKASNRADLAGRRAYLLGLWAARTGDRERARQELRAVLAQPNQHLVALAALRLGQLAMEAGARAEAAGWLEQARRTALALGAEKLAGEAERAEKALHAGSAAEDDSPQAAAARLEVLLAEARGLLPRVTAPAEELAELREALRKARALNVMWPKLFAARTPSEAAEALATATFEVLPGATRVFVLDPGLEPWAARGRAAGEIPFAAGQIDAKLCEAAMAEREVRKAAGGALAVPLAEGPTAPVWGVMYLVGEGLGAGNTLLAVADAGARTIGRLGG